MVFDADLLGQQLGDAARALPASRRALLRNIVIQAENAAMDLAKGPGDAPPGAYPIPVRTGTFRRGFGFEIRDSTAVLFNATAYAGAIHAGYHPYGNPHARPIPARPYFDDALKRIDMEAAARAWQAARA
ncbi:hypothetical protein DYQ93_11430 [Xanthomonas sp. LMG 8992]|uniref:hypothetical protein n=1 Tax=Xanthomonas sp. LMG 8992 TaxID=1591157 RepID=UPI001368C3CD|nr:hypothetical protein [Xanthomonas sp. LMG 8992]MXV11631.1 hypothetical protein [Xanthomonas sp. LMG 8992]